MGFDFNSTAEEVTEGLDLSGQYWLVTGCNSGLGKETTRVLSSRGAHIIAAARTQKKAELVKKMFSVYQENKDLVLMGGYNQGQNEQIDKALDLWPKICELIKQDYRKKTNFSECLDILKSFS